MSLSIFVNEDRTEVPGIAKSGTVVTLRKLTKNLLQTQSPVENIPETEVLIESQKISPDPSLTSADHAMDDEKYPAEKDILNRIKPSQEQQNQAFTGTSIPDTQERMQLAAIATMVSQCVCVNFQGPHVMHRLNCVQTAKVYTIHKSLI